MKHPVYLAVPPGPLHDACLEALDGAAVTVASPDELGSGDAAGPGVVLLAPDQLSVEGFVELAERLYGISDGWRFAVARQGSPLRLQVLSLGHPEEAERVASGLSGAEPDPGVLLELRHLLREVSKARHDINNPLTSGLAEAQLLLMDVEEPEVREGLDVIQTQLRRIRDLVADTGHIRPPRR